MPRILVIDDSEIMIEIIKNQLEESNISCSFASNGQSALELLEKDRNFDLILCDVLMDKMNGIEFAKAQEKNESIKNIPTVLMTSVFDSNFIKEIKDILVVKSWLIKPFNPEQLNLIINNILK
jgi:CheY-like chemotaxis protein